MVTTVKSAFCKPPETRTIEELLMYGVINIDKPAGPTSHQVTAWVKKILGISTAGHGGTLDPKVTGVLPIALEHATKALPALLVGEKEYVGIMRLHAPVAKKKLFETCELFVGEIYQVPPVRAAVKRELRTRKIYALELLEIELPHVLFKVRCEAGTYIRTLCHDIGEALGVGAHMAELRRIRTANFTEQKASTLHDLKDAVVFWKENDDEKTLRAIIEPMERLLSHLPKIIVKDSAVDALCHGANLAVPGVLSSDKNFASGTPVAILTEKSEAVGIGRTLMSSAELRNAKEGIVVDMERVLMPRGVYPRIWKDTQKI